MTDWKPPAWTFLPVKVLLLFALLLPVGLWIGSIVGQNSNLATEFKIHPSGTLSDSTETPTDTASVQTVSALDSGKPSESEPSGFDQKTGVESTSTTDRKWTMGIDVSHYQGTVNWEEVANSRVAFAFAKATGGTSFVDPEFKKNWHGMRANQLYRGAYHFFYASEDPVKQANHFINTIGKLSPNDFPPVLDVETLDNATPALLLQNVLTWLDKVEKETGRKPIVYTDVSFGAQYLTDSRLADYYLWVAEYGPKVKAVPEPWTKSGWQFWQYSNKGNVPGIAGSTDADFFSGGKDALLSFIQNSRIEPLKP